LQRVWLPANRGALRVTRWRGGIARESRAHHPFQPEIITSTVAQIGSRLLFRGYCVGERSLALEAGLAAVDTTICLDEAHLVEPFSPDGRRDPRDPQPRADGAAGRVGPDADRDAGRGSHRPRSLRRQRR
jgi:CRISPR-associated endonuclease/helicase Cas3